MGSAWFPPSGDGGYGEILICRSPYGMIFAKYQPNPGPMPWWDILQLSIVAGAILTATVVLIRQFRNRN